MSVLRREAATGTRRHRRVAALVRWPAGVALVSWRYLWRTTPIHRAEEPGGTADLPPGLPAEHTDDRVQRVADGYGPLLRRQYTVRIAEPDCDAEELMGRLAADPNRVAPSEFAVFRRTRGTDGTLTAGDEFLIRLPGPWDGPVRVIDSGPTGFRFATLRGHLEAGQIEFRVRPDTDRGPDLRFEIESWARPGDRLSHVLYNRLRLAKEVQLTMWMHVLLRTARLAGGRPRGGITVHTRRVAEPLPGGDDHR
ncbi:DUF1990 family protein [Pseudonocardia acidicola]|uniref:DUF1990 family protein n=1 Tax=Pseudonocardia acidicola TaxID=2724939 RepID=A0ABX1SBU8_9PSEU|nr:DUF1990 family protein [Pseudonocardia acidicola]NMH97663.1 DUF1990 family protein [Pseudonocardia acidicola]